MKNHPPTASGLPGVESRWTISAAAAALVVAVVVAYGNSFGGPFVFDDIASIAENPTIRSLGHAWVPPHHEGVTVGGRPLLNFSFALNYAISGHAVWSYHAGNLLIHVAAALTLFGLIRRTLERWSALPSTPLAAREQDQRVGGNALHLAFAITLLWALHPLQTESLTYVVQRAESLVGLFYLVTLYAFERGTECHLLVDNGPAQPGREARVCHPVDDAPRARGGAGWLALSVAACALGMATKEVMVSAPLVVLLYDRTFVSGTWVGAWRARRGFYFALAATWLPLAWLALGTEGRGGTAGIGGQVSVWHYALTQCEAIIHYVRLVVWPHPLVFDYGVDLVRSATAVVGPAVILLSLLGATGVALVRWPRWGFVGVWFFAILAPSSSFVPVGSQPIAEHRMYLPLAAVLAVLVLGVHAWLGRRSWGLWAVGAVVCGFLTWRRNEVYRSELALWSDTVASRPTNARAQSNLGNALLAGGRAAEAVPHYAEALRLHPDYADAANNLGRSLVQLGRAPEAMPHFEAALRAKPASVDVLTNYGSALAQVGRAREAVTFYERALQIAPSAIGARYNLANTLFRLGDRPTAATRYAEVVQLQPGNVDARFNLATTLLQLGRIPDAIAAYEDLLRLAPADATAHAELANILAHVDRVTESIAHFETALKLRPDFPAARAALDRLQAARGGAKP